jgi:hypothetical protein
VLLRAEPQRPTALAEQAFVAEEQEADRKRADLDLDLVRPVPVVVEDKRPHRAYWKADNLQEVPARVREGRCCTERLAPQRRDCSSLVGVRSLEREVSVVVVVVAAAEFAVAAAAAAAAGNQQELAVAKKEHWVAKHPWDEDLGHRHRHRHRVLDVAQGNLDKAVLDRVRCWEVHCHDRQVPQNLCLLGPTVGEDIAVTWLLN